MRSLVVIPTYNEAATIAQALGVLHEADGDVDALVVDDGSPDGTAEIVDKLAASQRGVNLLRRNAKQGLGRAYLAGFQWGLARGYDAVVEMDADLSHDPGRVPALLAALDDADLVIGSRYVPGGSIPSWSLRRRLLSRWGNEYSSWMLGVPVRDLTSGFRAYRASLLARLPLERVRAGGYGFQIEMAYRSAALGARVVELPISFVDRTDGQSKMSGSIMLEALGLVTYWGLYRHVGGQALARTLPPAETLPAPETGS